MGKQSRVVISSNNEIGINNDQLIARYLSTAAGRALLAQHMLRPSRTRLNYTGIARKIFQVDALPQGALPTYETKRKFKHNHVIINSKNDIGTRDQLYRFKNGTRVTIPAFTIMSNPTIKISDIKSRRFNIIDRSIQKARADIMCQEDSDIFAAIDSATKELPKKKSIFDNIKSWCKKLLQYLDI